MHIFQPIETKDFEINVFEKIGSNLFALTTKKDGFVNAMTAGWGGLGYMWGKPVAFVVVRESRYTLELLDQTDVFSMCFLEKEKYKTAMRYLGAVSGRQEDKIAALKLNIGYWKETPYIDEANTVICLKKLFKSPMKPEEFLDKSLLDTWYKNRDYHNLYMAEIEQILAR